MKIKWVTISTVIILTIVTVVVVISMSIRNQDIMKGLEITSNNAMSNEEVKGDQEQDNILSEKGGAMQNQENTVINESEEIIQDTYERSFGSMQEYRDGTLSKRFGYFVDEEMVKREIPLTEKDFEKLKKGQCLTSNLAILCGSEYSIGINDEIGESDGIVWLTSPSPGTGRGKTIPYYWIGNDAYVMLHFEDNDTHYPLERIEVWDAEGNKIRDILIN